MKRSPRLKLDVSVAEVQAVSKKIMEIASERERFLKNPERYLMENGISIPSELINKGQLEKSEKDIAGRCDPGSVAIAV